MSQILDELPQNLDDSVLSLDDSVLSLESTPPPSPPIVGNPLLAIYPPIGDLDNTKYKFYQINKGELPTPQNDFILKISGNLGTGSLLQPSGFDIRPYLNNERDISNAIPTGNNFIPGFTLQVTQLSDNQLHLFCWEFGEAIHEWVLSAPHVFPSDGTASDFQFTDPETNGRDIKFIDNGTKMSTIGIDCKRARVYSLAIPYSFQIAPVLLKTFSVNFITSTPQSCDFSKNGMQFYVIGQVEEEIYQWNLTAPFTLPLASTPPDRTFTYNPDITTSAGNSRMSTDGTHFYLMHSSLNDRMIAKYITTDGAYQIPIINKIPDDTFDVESLETNPRAISISVDDSFIWFSGRDLNTVFELFLPGKLLQYEIVSTNIITKDFTIKVKIPTAKDLTFIQIATGNASATDGSISLGTDNTLSLFETPLLTKDEDNFLVDEQGRNIVEPT